MSAKPLEKLKEISQLFDERGLTPDVDLKKTLASPSTKSLILPCHKDGKALVIKILLLGDASWRQRFSNELRFYKVYQKEAISFIPPIIEVCSEGTFPFAVFEKVDGKPLASSRVPEGAKSNWATKLAQKIEQIQKLPPLPATDSSFPRYDGEFLIQKVLKYRESTLVPQPLFEEIVTKLESSRETLDNACRVLIHGDFLFQNVIESNSLLFIVDWEFVGTGNEAYDAATLWLSTFRLSGWRKTFIGNLLEKIKNPKLFKSLFVSNLFRLYLREIKMWREVTGEPELATAVIENCKNELRLALRGFDALFEGG